MSIDETPVDRARAWLTTAQTVLTGYERLVTEGDKRGAEAALKSLRESLRTAEDCAFEALP